MPLYETKQDRDLSHEYKVSKIRNTEGSLEDREESIIPREENDNI